MADHGRGHDADRPGAGDQHVFAQHVERQGRVHRVAERIEDGLHVAGDGRVVDPDVGHRQRQVLGERPGPIDADALGVLAQVAAAGQAIAAAAADHVPFAADDVAGVEILDVAADLDDLGRRTRGPTTIGTGIGLLGPGVPVVDVNVGAANAGPQDLDQHVVDADLRLGDVFQPQAFFGFAS